jgi:hypothetical protein
MVKEGMLTKEEKTWLKASWFASSHERDSDDIDFFIIIIRTTTSDVMTGFLLSLKRINEPWHGLNERLSEI